MALNTTEATLLSRILVHQHSRALTLISIAIADGGDARADVTVTIAGCHKEPCAITVSVARATGVQFHRDFAEQLSEALDTHTDSRTDPPMAMARRDRADRQLPRHF